MSPRLEHDAAALRSPDVIVDDDRDLLERDVLPRPARADDDGRELGFDVGEPSDAVAPELVGAGRRASDQLLTRPHAIAFRTKLLGALERRRAGGRVGPAHATVEQAPEESQPDDDRPAIS